MAPAAQTFYGVSTLHDFTREDVLAGRVIKLNPALVTLTDDLLGKVEPEVLQQWIWEQVNDLLADRIRTFHVDLNFDDYRGFGRMRPPNNLAVFTPPFLARLTTLIRSRGGFLNLHLLTDAPERHLARLAPLTPGRFASNSKPSRTPAPWNTSSDALPIWEPAPAR
jgi:hypothetical protein